MKKFFEFLLIIIVPWIIIFLIIFSYNNDKDDHYYSKKSIVVTHDPKPVDHSQFDILQQEFKTGPEVTKACLSCHNKVGDEFMKTEHWLWHKKDSIPGRGVFDLGKKNVLNNFCIGVNSNEKLCSLCHAGYGYGNKDFDFSNQNNIDCLVCHDQTKLYHKSKPSKTPNTGSGLPALNLDLSNIAQNVGTPKRNNCGNCHFTGGGGNNVKHGDLEKGLLNAHSDSNGYVDVHMGVGENGYNMECIDCHKTSHHQISGQLYTVSSSNTNHVACTQCHSEKAHKSEILNDHFRSVACQTCHISNYAKLNRTKIIWDWSTATKMGNDGKPVPHDKLSGNTYTFEGKTYNDVEIQFDSKHGTAVFKKNVQPEYVWFNGTANHHLINDKITDTTKAVILNPLFGSYADNVHPVDSAYPSKIWPVKIMRGKQPYDPVNMLLIQPKLVGKAEDGALWADFDWNTSSKAGMEYMGLPYSGKYAFIETQTIWPLNHEVSQAKEALQCIDCHNSSDSRLKELTGFYLPGRDQNYLLDMSGILFIILVLLGVSIHGVLRVVSNSKKH